MFLMTLFEGLGVVDEAAVRYAGLGLFGVPEYYDRGFESQIDNDFVLLVCQHHARNETARDRSFLCVS